MSTSVSSNQSSTGSRSPKGSSKSGGNRRSARKWIIGSATILMLLAGFFVIRTQGYVSGTEFAPTHFQTRTFNFYEIPLLHVQITPIVRSIRTDATAQYLLQKSLIPLVQGSAQTWHLANLSRGLTGSRAADASFLVDQLLIESGGSAHWKKWSVDHPKLASELWPIVQKLAKRELYLLIPSLFELASTSSSVEELQESIDRYLEREYIGLIEDMKAADREPLAAALLAEARLDFPSSAKLAELEAANPLWAQFNTTDPESSVSESPVSENPSSSGSTTNGKSESSGQPISRFDPPSESPSAGASE